MPIKKPKKDTSPLPDSLAAHYGALVESGRILEDNVQKSVLSKLQERLDSFKPIKKKFSLLRPKKTERPRRSLYIWGNVGRGKSMLMDLFFAATPVEKKRRVHFHAFMQEVYARIHELRKNGKGDPVAVLARELADENSLLCFDELQATDVADATLLYRLFERLFERDVMIISTSNHPPASLYTGGVQAERFAKFIALLEEKMEIAPLSSPEDYRYLQGTKTEKTSHFPLGAEANAFIADVLRGKEKSQEILVVQGRSIIFTAYDQTTGLFSFDALCASAHGAADYLALAKRLKVLILTDIPKISPEQRNEAKRFVTLIDTLYEHKVKLLYTAATRAEEIYSEGDGAFEFHRTVSRLVEMGSANYLAAHNND